ncbi:aminotransferase class V-fold PLP-dependent enzyme [Natronogracilivirga saccharolytica]|uniref:Cysteine desulfurase n=1 Tax=Natronogracilivirga saccharolytica TaxID=2812953 RepID=A0A8J7UUJ8_9BACT|nr:cysteine desulfurase [Natronogracilivirga saccharolytica]MBP3193701.1 cysteine desulfurase [Natronogracilivirga saccharolytica]
MSTVLKDQHTTIQNCREDFPVLSRKVHGKPLAYLDNAASSQMPRQVQDAYRDYHSRYHANVHRGVHLLSQEATDAMEQARESLRSHINARESKEIIFTSGATDAMNLVMQSWGRKNIGEGDEILISTMEHHSNIVPWKMLCDDRNASLKVIPVSDDGILDLDAFESMISDRTRLVGIVHVSNTLGTVNPVEKITKIAHGKGVPVLVDGAQAVSHMQVDVQKIGCDFYATSGHKMYGPTGIGILYGRKEMLEEMPPYRGGGDMILSVSFDEVLFNDLPYKFEAGTPNISGAIGMGRAAEYIRSIGYDAIYQREQELLAYATSELSAIEGLNIIGKAPGKSSVISFVLDSVHPHDIGTILDLEGVAVRTGHHCTQPLMERLGLVATTRASMAMYNTEEEIDQLVAALHKVLEIFR